MSCAEHRELLWAYAHGELEASSASLKRQAILSHVSGCSRCSAAYETLRDSKHAIADYAPAVDPEHLARLSERLQPYVEAAERRSSERGSGFYLAIGAGAGVLAMALVASVVFRSVPAKEPVASAPFALRYDAVTPFLRVASASAWDGRNEVSADQGVVVRATRGSAAFSLQPGLGQKLRVETPHGTVTVIGTRFVVSAMAEGLRVHVAEGAVRVHTSLGETEVRGGEGRLFTRQAVTAVTLDDAETRRLLEDASLVAHHAAAPLPEVEFPELAAPDWRLGRLPTKAWVSKRKVIEPATLVDPMDILAELDEAEALAQRGEAREAIEVYRRIAADERAAYDPYRDLARYEMARLYGFALGDTERARAVFSRLRTRGDHEVHRQASLALCELLEETPCEAKRCLGELASDGTHQELAREAARLAAALGVVNCPEGK